MNIPRETEITVPKLNLSEEVVRREPARGAEEPRPDLLDLFLALAKRKRFIVSMTVAGGLIAATAALLMTPLYTAISVIMPPQQQQSTATALLGQLGSIAGLAGGGLGLKTPGDLYIGILGGRTIADNLVNAFDLRELYKVKTLTDARKALASRTVFSTGKDSLIKISVEDHDPKRAAALANAYVDELYKQNSRLALTESAQRRLFFEKQLETQKKALTDAEAAFKATQERTGVVQVTSQVESVIRALAGMRAEIATREVALYALKSGATVQNPDVVRQEAELTALREQLRKLEASAANSPGDPFISTSRVPKLGLEYLRALRDLQYNETLFELLSKQYEVARIDEAKDAPVIQIVDSAVPPDRKTWPPRTVLTVSGAFGFGILACLIALVSHRYNNPADAEKLRLLWRTVTGSRSSKSPQNSR